MRNSLHYRCTTHQKWVEKVEMVEYLLKSLAYRVCAVRDDYNKYKYFSTHSTHKNSIYNKTDSIFEGNVRNNPKVTDLYQSSASEHSKVLPCETSPVSKPRLNHLMR